MNRALTVAVSVTAYSSRKKGGAHAARASARAAASMQPGGVVGDSAHFRFGHAAGDWRHHPAVGVLALLIHTALTGLERLQLRQRVIGVLARQPRITYRNTDTGRRVAGRTCGHAGGRVASAVQFLAGSDKRRIFRGEP